MCNGEQPAHRSFKRVRILLLLAKQRQWNPYSSKRALFWPHRFQRTDKEMRRLLVGMRRSRQWLCVAVLPALVWRSGRAGAVWALWFTGTKPRSLVRPHQRSASLVPLLLVSVVVNSLWITYSVILFYFLEGKSFLKMAASCLYKYAMPNPDPKVKAANADCWQKAAFSSGFCSFLYLQSYPEGWGLLEVRSRLGKGAAELDCLQTSTRFRAGCWRPAALDVRMSWVGALCEGFAVIEGQGQCWERQRQSLPGLVARGSPCLPETRAAVWHRASHPSLLTDVYQWGPEHVYGFL